LTTDFLDFRIALIVISVILLTISVILKKRDRIGSQFFAIMLIFWAAVLIIALVPQILDSVLTLSGLINPAQFLFGISLIMIFYLLFAQTVKSKNTVKATRLIRELALSNFQRDVKSSNENVDLIIIITAKDESKSIGTVIDKINSLKIPYSYKILVVNDGSEDNTEEIAKNKGALVLTHLNNLGIGAAIKTGFIASRSFDPEIVINIDADGQHDPQYIPKIISKIKDDNADLVYASRFAKQSNYKTSTVRSAGNKFYTKLVNNIAKISITDVTSGYRAMRYDKLRSVLFLAETNFAIELAIRAGRNGLKIMEIPVNTGTRETGKSQFHRIEKFFLYNINALGQIFNAYSKKTDNF